MANNYKVKGNVGQWTDGQVITDADLDAAPGMGGAKRLRDQLGVIEDTTDEPTGDADARLPENTTGSPSRQAKKAADAFAARTPAPNAGPAAETTAVNQRTGGTGPAKEADKGHHGSKS